MPAPELVLRNARIVLPDGVASGDVVVRNGLIVDIAGLGTGRAGDDVGGDFLIPGLVELHTDHLESHYAPRPGVRWSARAAVQAHDAQVATAGITTVLDALRVGTDEDVRFTAADMRGLADAIEGCGREGSLRAEHFLHLRCEVSAADALEGFSLFEADPRLKLASLMDHTPGQRQFTSLATYRTYYQGKTGMSDAAFEAFVARRTAQAGRWSAKNRALIAERCRERGIVVASHDDATAAHVAEAVRDGVTVAEFPTTVEAAAASRAAGMTVLMGAPNVVRGASHSGNVSARALAEAGLLDALSSDYVPLSLLHAVFLMGGGGDVELARAVCLVTAAPAGAAGLGDRGAIEIGRRADLVQVAVTAEVPVVRRVWREGVRVA
jgi:alpha-D-ribose 1-methylphosphonate 5-triphosphate diphosphatase